MTLMPERSAPPPDLYADADVRRAARALLRTPLLHNDAHADDLALVRRHQGQLTTLFADGLGYRLVVEPGLARLVKTGLGPDPTRGLRRRNGTPFTPRRYALLALTLAALTRSRRQLMVDELVAHVRAAAADAGIDVDLDAIHDRRALHSAIVALVDLGVLRERDGDLEHWAERRTEALLDIQRDRLAVIVAAPLSRCEGPEDLLAVASVPSAAGGARVSIRRLLTERPVLSTDDLTDEQRGWWRRNREREREWFHRWFGLDLELRAEGAVAIDPTDDLTDLTFPGAGSAKHFALLLLAELVEAVHHPDHGRHAQARGRHPDEAGRHPDEAVRHPDEAARHRDEAVRHRDEAVGRSAARHPDEAVRHPDEAVGRSAARHPDDGAWARLAASTVRSAGDRVFARWHLGLRKAHQQDRDLVYEEALSILVAVGLVRRDEAGVEVHAAAARYAPRPEFVTATGPAGERSLFDEETS